MEIPNIVKITKHNKVESRTLDPLQVGINEDKEIQALEMTEFLLSTNEKVQKNLELNYQEWNSQIEPAWNSRFIRAPRNQPSDEDIDKYEDVEIDIEEKGEMDGEFDEYIYKDFLEDMKEEIEKAKMTDEDRYKYILSDIEKDRERILREAIDGLRRPFKK